MADRLNLEQYLTKGIENIVKSALKSTLDNPRESLFLARYALAAKKAARLRAEAEQSGEHIPGFLIASIAEQCNLHCFGCYARANHSCSDSDDACQTGMAREEWSRIFGEAAEMGVGFILLAGGEPLMRRDVLEEAAGHPDIIFPVFTNGTLLNEEYLALFDKQRNLVPVLSLEGGEKETDRRRGRGIYRQMTAVMSGLYTKGILYGVSVTVTKENLAQVTADDFLEELRRQGCRVVIYVEYVPVDAAAGELAPGEAERHYLQEKLARLRGRGDSMVFLSFPGDEAAAGGCLAAGRGFFHINARGGAEPCPFSPYSDTSLKHKSLREALRSPLFLKLIHGDLLNQKHSGGCVLFEQEHAVKQMAVSD